MAIHSQYVTGRKVSIIIHTIVYKDANIWGPCNVCSHLPFEELTASMASLYTVSVLAEDIQAFLEAAVTSLCVLATSVLTPTPTSTYGLGTAVT